MTTAAISPAQPRPHRVRVVTAASLFDGHDAAINIMRRILQAQGAEVIHLGHDRGVDEIVTAAVQEDAHAVAWGIVCARWAPTTSGSSAAAGAPSSPRRSRRSRPMASRASSAPRRAGASGSRG